MSNGEFKPKERYKTSGVSARGQTPAHLTKTDYTQSFKQAVLLEQERAKEAKAEQQLKEKTIGQITKSGQDILDKRSKSNKKWLLGEDAETYSGAMYGDTEVFRASDDFMTKQGWAKQTMEFTPEFEKLLSDEGNLKTFFDSSEGQDIMSMIHKDPNRFTRMPGFTKAQWNVLEGIDPQDISSTMQGWVDDPATTPKAFLDWSTTGKKNEAAWAEDFGGDSGAQALTKGCFGKRGGAGCGGGKTL